MTLNKSECRTTLIISLFYRTSPKLFYNQNKDTEHFIFVNLSLFDYRQDDLASNKVKPMEAPPHTKYLYELSFIVIDYY